jgi:hypothetical protein
MNELDRTGDELARALADIDADPRLSPAQKLRAKAQAARDYRVLNDRPGVTYGRADRTSPGRAFATSAARSLGSGLIRAILRGLFGGR